MAPARARDSRGARACAPARESLKATGDTRLAERVDDLLDLERQVLRRARWRAGAELRDSSRRHPARARSHALATHRHRSRRSSAASRWPPAVPLRTWRFSPARSAFPCWWRWGRALLTIPAGTMIILDADEGVLHRRRRTRTSSRPCARGSNNGARSASATSPPHNRIAILQAASASRCSPISPAPTADATLAVAQGAEGCGLLRTEFLFLERDHRAR